MLCVNPEMDINLAALQRLDNYIVCIVEMASQVAVYRFHSKANAWTKVEIEGSLFVCARKQDPKHVMIILNRLNRQNFVEPIVQGLEVQEKDEYLLYRNNRADIWCIWFYMKTECTKVSHCVHRLLGNYQNLNIQHAVRPDYVGMPMRSPSSVKIASEADLGNTHLLQLLSKAHSQFVQGSPSGPSGITVPPPKMQNVSVASLFSIAAASESPVPGAAPTEQPAAKAVPNGGVEHEVQQSTVPPVLQQLFACPPASSSDSGVVSQRRPSDGRPSDKTSERLPPPTAPERRSPATLPNDRPASKQSPVINETELNRDKISGAAARNLQPKKSPLGAGSLTHCEARDQHSVLSSAEPKANISQLSGFSVPTSSRTSTPVFTTDGADSFKSPLRSLLERENGNSPHVLLTPAELAGKASPIVQSLLNRSSSSAAHQPSSSTRDKDQFRHTLITLIENDEEFYTSLRFVLQRLQNSLTGSH